MLKRLIILFACVILLSCKQEVKPGGSHDDETIIPKRPEGVCKITILNQVNGSYAEGLNLTIKENDTKEKLFDGFCNKGVIFVKLEAGKSYDFCVSGNASYASSLITNYKVKTITDDIAIICLFKAQKTRGDAFLSMQEFKFINDGGEATEVVDGLKVNTPIKGKFTAKVSSSSGAIYESVTNGFAAKIGLGKIPSSSNNSKQDIKGIPEGYPEFENSQWISKFNFLLEAQGGWLSYTREEQDLIAVFYDVAGNRLETHNYIICEPQIANFQKYSGTDYYIGDFYVEARTYQSYNQIYSLGPSRSEESIKDFHYAPNIFFSVRNKHAQMANIIAVEIFRREEGRDFTHIFTSSFKNPSDINESRSSPIPFLIDRTGTCEIDKEYEYKAKIYIKEGYYFETEVAKCKIMPEHKVYLSKPIQHACVSMPSRYAPFNAVLPDFAVTISNPCLWDAKKSDYFTCGLIIKTFRDVELYRMLFRYHFDYKGTGKEELEFLANYNQKTMKTTLTELKTRKIVPYYVEVDDFVEWDGSQVIIKKELLSTRVFNISDRWDTFKDGEVYWWDVFGVTGELPESIRGLKQMPPVFTKEYKSDSGVVSYSHTYGAWFSLNTTSSANGRFDFTVKSEKELDNILEKPSMENIVDGSYIVKADERFEREVLSFNSRIVGKMSLGNGISWYCIKYDGEKDILFKLLSIEGVINADYQHKVVLPYKNEKIDVLSQLSFNDPVLQGSSYSLEITQALKAYEEIGFGDEPLLIGIVDTGVFLTHEDLKDSDGQSIIKDYFVQNYVDQGGGQIAYNGWISSKVDTDLNGHGTHCIGVMAAPMDNGRGIIGVSGKNTKVVMYRGLADKVDVNGQNAEFCSMDAIRKFTDYVKKMRTNGKLNQACVPINLSVGITTPSPLAIEVINYALANGVLPVVAMANDGLYLPSYPSAYKGVVAVGSSNGSDRVSGYSNRGEWISIVAPGENIISLSNSLNNGYVVMNGTSMAAPFVTGAIAYLAGLDPEITPIQMKYILEKTADKIEGDENFNTKRGYGRINVYKAAKLIKSGGVDVKQTKYSSFALKAKIDAKVKDENGETEIDFGNFVPYVFLYDDRGVCIAGGYLVAPDVEVSNKDNMNVVEFRGLEKGRYTLKVHSYVYTDWPKVYRLLDEKTVDFTGDQDELVEFDSYVVIKK